jgi:hypothetical protein
MRALAVGLLVAFVGAPAPAADKNEDKAKEAALAFLKAVKAKDKDAVMKTVAAPFAHREGGEIGVVKDEAELKTWIKGKLDELKDADKVPTELEKVVPFADLKDQIKDEADKKKVEDVVGKDGFVAIIQADGKMVVILVKVTDGKAKVVGIGH